MTARTRAIAVIAYAFAVTMIGTTLPTPLYPIYQQEIGFSALIVTVVFAAYGAGVLVALLFIAPLSDRFGRRALLLPGIVLAAASSVVFLLAHGLPLLFVGRILSGLSAGMFTGTATAAIIELAPPDKRDRATLLAAVVNIGGLGVGPILAGALAQVASDPLRLPYLVHLALLVPAVVAIALIPEPGAAPEPGDPPEPQPRAGAGSPRLGVPRELRPLFIRAGSAAFAAFATLGLFSAVAPSVIHELLGLSSHLLTGAVVSLVFIASAVGQLGMGRLHHTTALRLGCGLMIAGMALIAAALALSSLALLIAGGIAAGFGNGLSFRAGLSALNEQSPPEQRGAVNSSFFVIAYVAISLPIVGVGAASQAIGLRAAGLAFTGCIATLALAVLLSLSSFHRATPPGTPRTAATVGSTDSP
jgi:MFS family permease